MVATGWNEWNLPCKCTQQLSVIYLIKSHLKLQDQTDLCFSFELYASAKFSKEHQIQDDWSSKKRVLACVVQHDGVCPTHENLRCVLVHCPFTISHIRYILHSHCTIHPFVKHKIRSINHDGIEILGSYLDDNHMIRMLSGLIEYAIASNHVIDHITFGNLLGTECLWGRQIHAVIVSQVVVAHYRCWLQSHINTPTPRIFKKLEKEEYNPMYKNELYT